MSNRAHECSWRAVADPRHSVSWLCGQDPSTRAIVADRRGCGFILESMHKLRTCGALQSGVALLIHTGDSVARLIQDTDTLNKLQCGATASRTQSRSCVPGLRLKSFSRIFKHPPSLKGLLCQEMQGGY